MTKNDNIDVVSIYSHYYYHHHQRMQSFKDRFRPSRKYKKTKDAGVMSTDETVVTSGNFIDLNPTTAAAMTSIIIDEPTPTNLTSISHLHYSTDYCKWILRIRENLFRWMRERRRFVREKCRTVDRDLILGLFSQWMSRTLRALFSFVSSQSITEISEIVC